jgi:hypothetical protein
MTQDLQNVTSLPSRKMIVLIVISFLTAIGMTVADHKVLDWVLFLVFAVANIVLLIPRIIWGFKICGDQIVITFPLWPRFNLEFTQEDLAQAEVVRNPIRVFSFSDFLRLRFNTGREIGLILMGTSHPQFLIAKLTGKLIKT